ncbi:Protein ssh4 [Cytospora mali]|uniref:Protein ssh4 n=1 Tax=Cytospora mali TaxID=578113 RepID=A0A194W2S9_CYTMA|nr:Protein ssh4 [Valsa mali]
MGFGSFKSNNPFRHSASAQGNNNDIGDVPPPPGPPPSHRPAAASGAGSPEQYAPPPGPPPSYSQGKGKYNHDDDNLDYIAPPPGPPPSKQPQPQHDWEQAVPDTSLLPPPPDLFSGWDSSPSTNAPEEQAEAGEAWCRTYPLSPPTDLSSTDPMAPLRQASLIPRLIAPPPGVFSKGSSLTQTGPGPGAWTVRTDRRGGDCCIIGYPHVYLVQRDSPLATGRARTVYFECRVGEMGRDAGLAVGFQALPYPPFRMPGWHRGSLAVHGDDGHKYVNDRWGGKDFTEPFRKGEVVGIGMVFSPGGGGGSGGGGGGLSSSGDKGKGKESGGVGEPGMIQVEVFFTRGGRETGRWDMHESLDSETDLPITGLEGYHDLTVAIGTYGSVGAEVVLDPSRWMFKP